MKSYQLTIPSNIYAGKSSIDNLVNIITKENVKSILVFTDKGCLLYTSDAADESTAV